MKTVLIAIFLLAGYRCSSCSCMDILSEMAVSIFMGDVVNIEQIKDPYECYIIKIKVNKYLKRAYNSDTLYVQTHSLNEASCGIDFEVGKGYTVYATIKDKMLYTNYCWGTTKERNIKY